MPVVSELSKGLDERNFQRNSPDKFLGVPFRRIVEEQCDSADYIDLNGKR